MLIFSIFFFVIPSRFMTSIYPAGQLSNLLLRIWGFPGIPITSNEFDLPNSIHTCQPRVAGHKSGRRPHSRHHPVISGSDPIRKTTQEREAADLAPRQQTARDLIGRIKETRAGLFWRVRFANSISCVVRQVNVLVQSGWHHPSARQRQIHPTGLKS